MEDIDLRSSVDDLKLRLNDGALVVSMRQAAALAAGGVESATHRKSKKWGPSVDQNADYALCFTYGTPGWFGLGLVGFGQRYMTKEDISMGFGFGVVCAWFVQTLTFELFVSFWLGFRNKVSARVCDKFKFRFTSRYYAGSNTYRIRSPRVPYGLVSVVPAIIAV